MSNQLLLRGWLVTVVVAEEVAKFFNFVVYEVYALFFFLLNYSVRTEFRDVQQNKNYNDLMKTIRRNFLHKLIT